MHKSLIFAATSLLFLSVPVAPLPSSQPFDFQPFDGKGVWSNIGNSTGACGFYIGDMDAVVALSPTMYDSGSHCNHNVFITDAETGQTATARVGGTCASCGNDDLDMTHGLFKAIGGIPSVGRLQISWVFF